MHFNYIPMESETFESLRTLRQTSLNECSTFLGTSHQISPAGSKLPVIVCEYAYPSEEKFPGQFADWNKPVAGYPLTPEGQAKWIADFLTACRGEMSISGTFYWSPEWHASDGDMWRAFALFDAEGKPKGALKSLASKP